MSMECPSWLPMMTLLSKQTGQLAITKGHQSLCLRILFGPSVDGLCAAWPPVAGDRPSRLAARPAWPPIPPGRLSRLAAQCIKISDLL